AFYGIRPSARAAEGFYHAMVEWFGRLGCPPDKAAVWAPGFGKNLGSFARKNVKVEKTGFRAVTHITLVSTTPSAELWGRDYYVIASYTSHTDVGDKLTAVMVAR